ncbi:hypothetical protein KZZ52_38565 [Dactylosporangium sp. AC04546]|uniref:hypothetical protein n=1 Tax=Dactylosporangium sp. AC04546 TaxID=2862460 RepID=UPI001EDF8CC9|nr:hypothetical protein [Dactylosporangium sp. AC04546]WVK79860.1 hypothetical protein KZZ52_38565 [Dactylosporangium sp. AC04546]
MLVEVQVKVPGRGRDELPVARIAVDGELTAGELIDLAVGEQIRLLAADGERCRAALDRQYLSPEDVQAQSLTGVVRLSQPSETGGPPDPAVEAARARRAFERGVFVVFAGGRQLERLDDPVALRPDEPVLFLRLTPLAGG